ncbi:MAG: aldehyde ferredoxin oxidoreductase N-terminal domain-containing protein [Anaerolineae bacterium]
MRAIAKGLERFAPMCGWSNRILRVDLSGMTAHVEETARYLPAFIGGRGLAAAVAWDEYPQAVDPFAPENPLMVFGGALTGSASAYSGRTSVCGFSPQGYPFRWFSRSNVGGHFGAELKRAGYDGIVVTGVSERPVRILVCDDQVYVRDAQELWGLDALDTLAAIEAAEGGSVRSLVIGPAGERLSRIATIQTASSSACGHGGFGAVMGAKKLKAISVVGSGQVALAQPARVVEITRAVGREARCGRRTAEHARRVQADLAAEGGGSVRPYACTASCVSPCGLYYKDVPGRAHARNWDGHWFCVADIFRGYGDDGPHAHGGVFDWRLGLRGGMELNALTNRYGLNQWDIIIGMVPWLEACQHHGLLGRMFGRDIDWRSSAFWDVFLHALAFRQDEGDALAEGGWAAAPLLGLGEDLVRRYYTGWGHAGHWDGHGDWANYVVFPFWLVPALQWLTDTRDPIPSGHGYASRIMGSGVFANDPGGITWDHMRAIAARVYGDARALDPEGGYEGKAAAAEFHSRRAIIKDCLSGDDMVFPMLYSRNTPDRLASVAGLEGPAVEHALFVAGTGVDWDEAEFNRAAARVYTLERALQVRHFGRDRALDSWVLPSFSYPENWASPLLGERQAMDRPRFEQVMDDYYRRLGWDAQNGWPTKERLVELGLADIDVAMREGAQAAQEARPRPEAPGEVPTVDLLTPGDGHSM